MEERIKFSTEEETLDVLASEGQALSIADEISGFFGDLRNNLPVMTPRARKIALVAATTIIVAVPTVLSACNLIRVPTPDASRVSPEARELAKQTSQFVNTPPWQR